MILRERLSKRDGSSDRSSRQIAGRVTDRLEATADTVGELSTRVRRAATERTDGAIDRGVDELRDRSVDEVVAEFRDESVDRVDEVRKRLVDRAVETCCEQLTGLTPDELREQADCAPGAADPIERAVDAFVRRYGLEKARLDDATIETIRDRVSAETNEPVDAEQVLERLEQLIDGESVPSGADEDPTADAALSRSTVSIEDALAETCSTLRDDLNLDSDQSLGELVSDILQQDAVVVGHVIERVLTEDAPRIAEQLDGAAEPDGTEAGPFETRAAKTCPADGGGTERPSIPSAPGSDGPAGPIEGLGGTKRSVQSIITTAIAAMAVLTEEGTSEPSLGQLLPLLASSLAGSSAGGEDGAALERVLVDLVSTLVLEADGGLDLTALQPDSMTSKGSLALVGLFVANLVAMSLGAWVSRKKAPPIPDEIRDPNGETIVTDEQVRLGKKAFQANGLMNQGSVLGNGSYFGVDLTADALELKAEYMREYYARQHGADTFEDLADDDRAVVAERVERELDGDAPEGPIAQYTEAEADAHRRIRDQYVDRYYGGSPERGIPQGFVNSADEAARIADFACWTAWMAHTNRPESDHSYTNDWPYVPASGNRPTGQVLVWSTISVVLLIAGGGAGVWAYHEIDFAEPTTEIVDVPSPDSVSITPAQYAAAWYVPVAGALFVAQALVGAYLAHYYVERTGFYGIGDALGIDLVSLLPFSVGRTWHINLGVLWITTLWLAGGLFLPGLFTDRDPPWQAESATALLGVLVATTVGAFAGVWLSSQGAFSSPADGELWWWLGSEGLEYLEVGRLWKLLLLTGFVSWTGLVLRSVRQLDEPLTGLGHFMTYAGGSIALMFAASMLYTPETNMAVTEFWRWWVVHMWVEGVFEFFVTAVISVALVSMDLLEKGAAEQAIFFEVFTIMAAGIVGVSHHYWWVGLPDIWVPIGTTFSTLEFVPLVFVLYRSIGEYRSLRAQGEDFPYTLPLLFIVGSSVWNFVGGGVLGFFINLPVINYYEHGTYLTVAHAHTATFGAFGLLALGLGTYILRVITPESDWNPALFRGAFWLTNIGLTVMTVASLLPIGFLQLQTAYQDGYAAARSLEFYEQDYIQTLLWARTLGDTPMILGALAFTAAAVRHLWAARGRAVETSPTDTGGLLPR